MCCVALLFAFGCAAASDFRMYREIGPASDSNFACYSGTCVVEYRACDTYSFSRVISVPGFRPTTRIFVEDVALRGKNLPGTSTVATYHTAGQPKEAKESNATISAF
jgi:hypothetical protein